MDEKQLILILGQHVSFLISGMLATCFYVDYDSFEYHLWANHREEIEEILRHRG